MAVITILGESGSGKSTSMRNLNHEETMIIQCTPKMLPFKGARKKYNKENKNFKVVDNYQSIYKSLNYLQNHEEGMKKKILILDDAQYLMAHEYMTSTITGFDKFNVLANNFYTLMMELKNMRDDLNIYVMSHTDVDEHGTTRQKSIGKLLNDKICLEGLVSIVLKTEIRDGKYYFTTQTNGRDTVKSPQGMFESMLIDNDLTIVDEAIREY